MLHHDSYNLTLLLLGVKARKIKWKKYLKKKLQKLLKIGNVSFILMYTIAGHIA